jgi:hypothetical protein
VYLLWFYRLVKKTCNLKTATIIKAKDNKGSPIENIPLKFYGYSSYDDNYSTGGDKREDTFKIEKKL